MITARFVFLSLGMALAGKLASASSVLYDNGPANGSVGGWTISSGFEVADSFMLGTSSTLTGVKFASWLSSGDVGTNVDWAIVTGVNGQGDETVLSGTGAALHSTFLFTNSSGFDVYEEYFHLGSLSLAPGMYFLELMNGTTAQDNAMYWDETDGNSQAWQNTLGFLTTADGDCVTSTSGNCSESFQIIGTPSATPEGSSFALCALGLFGVVTAASCVRRCTN